MTVGLFVPLGPILWAQAIITCQVLLLLIARLLYQVFVAWLVLLSTSEVGIASTVVINVLRVL